VNVGRWKFIEREQVDLYTREDIEELEELLSHAQEILGAVETRTDNLVIMPEDADFKDLGFSGFASCTVERLRSNIEESGGPDSVTSRNALALLVMLAGRER